MEPEIAGDPPAGKDRSGNAFERMPELPSVRKRWTVRRKAAVIEAVRRGRLSLDQVCRLYTLSLEEAVPNLSSDRHAKSRLKMAPRTLTEQLALSLLARG